MLIRTISSVYSDFFLLYDSRVYLYLKPRARAVWGDYRPEVLTVRTERSMGRTN